MNPRACAAHVVRRVVADRRSLANALPEYQVMEDARQRALVQELAYGVMRWYIRLDAIAEQLLLRPLKERDLDLRCLILVGLYQLACLGVPAHAAVHETVAATRDLGKGWGSGLVNAVLRGYQRRSAELGSKLDRDPVTCYAHPAWLLEYLRGDWPQHWEAIARADNERPPLSLRVNVRYMRRDEYLAQLNEADQAAVALEYATQGIRMLKPAGVDQLPGFAEGWVSVQDGAAQLAALVLEAGPGERVLDACAAPGGKTGHILELQPDLAYLAAVDRDKVRLQQVAENLLRLGLTADLIVADATRPETWWDGRPYDRILLDAPCSASGVIRRHPDIKLLRQASDVSAVAETQKHLLAALWPLLSPGGMLLYATCSVLRQENSAQIEEFIARHPDAIHQPIPASWGHECECGRQILSGEGDMDGFYFARLIKKAVAAR
jgi:16S rRNA (cytosine967-C5)-methyltransferase